jgi:hypothetical protein
LNHESFREVSAGKAFAINAKVVGVTDSANVSVQINRMGGPSRSIRMTKDTPFDYRAEVPAELVTPGLLSYRIIVRDGKETAVYPGDHKGDPFAWDNYINETWTTYVAGEGSVLELYNPTHDRAIRTFPVFRRGFQTSYITGQKPGQLILKMTSNGLAGAGIMGFQYVFVDKVAGRISEMESFDKIVIRARNGTGSPVRAKVLISCADGSSASAFITLTDKFGDIEVSVSSFEPDAAVLLPRPYPGFLPFSFRGSGSGSIDLAQAERIELTIGSGMAQGELERPYSLEVECIWLGKNGDDLKQ